MLNDGGEVGFEVAVDPALVSGLRARGHKVQIGKGFYGRYQGILKDPVNGVYRGASDARVDGTAGGY
jgi:gamma-glutamyltranspeptidase/glutathione hydrolase